MTDIIARIEHLRIIPVISLDHPEDIIPLCTALQDGGLECAEITFRTAAAPHAIRLVKEDFPRFMLGAGTITSIAELDACREAGAQFAVAPGLNPAVVRNARENEFPFFPGVCTPSEIETALDLGCSILKFFPAEALGGVRFLKALYGPYKHRGVRFIPTGGINSLNYKEYLSCPGVLAVGGSWLVDKTLIREKNWQKITDLTREAVSNAG